MYKHAEQFYFIIVAQSKRIFLYVYFSENQKK